jgi:hypothetical protein
MTAGKTILVLERARPFQVHAGGKLDLLGDHATGFLDKADLVAAAHAKLDVRAEQSVLALDHRRPFDHPDVGDSGQRDLHRSGLVG